MISQRKRSLNISLYFMASMVQTVVGLVTSPIISKSLSHRDFAIVGYFNSYLALFTPVVGLTLGTYYARNYFKIDAEKRQRMKNTILTVFLSIGVVSTSVILSVFFIYMKLYNVGFPFFPYAVLCFFTMIFSQTYNFYLLNLRLTKEAKRYFGVSLVHHLMYGVMMILLCVVLGYGAAGSLAATLIVAAVFSVYCVYKILDRFQLDWIILKDALSFCWPLIIAGCLHYFFSGLDRAFLAGFKDDRNLGLYNIAFRITSYIGLFYSAITMTVEPDFYKAIAQKKYKRLLIIIVGMLLVKTAIVIVFNVIAPYVISVLTAGRYTESVRYARILSLKNITSSIYTFMSLLIIGFGYSKVTLANRIIGTVGVIVMYRILIQLYGFDGAAWGQVFSYVIMTIFSLAFISFKLISRRRYLRTKSL